MLEFANLIWLPSAGTSGGNGARPAQVAPPSEVCARLGPSPRSQPTLGEVKLTSRAPRPDPGVGLGPGLGVGPGLRVGALPVGVALTGGTTTGAARRGPVPTMTA